MNQQDISSSYSKRTDIDRDGVPDYKDCRPLDPTRQHIKPNKLMKKELENLPTTFLVTDLSPVQAKKDNFYTLGSKEAKWYCPEAVRNIWGILKRNPHILSAIKKAKPKVTVYYAGIKGTEALDWTGSYLKYKRRIQFRKPDSRKLVITIDKRHPIKGESRSIIAKKRIRYSAGTIFHETFHISGPFWHRHSESKAREYAENMLRKRELEGKPLPPEAFNYPYIKGWRKYL